MRVVPISGEGLFLLDEPIQFAMIVDDGRNAVIDGLYGRGSMFGTDFQ